MADAPDRGHFSLKRWSQRKHAAARDAASAPPPSPAPPAAAPPATAPSASSQPVVAGEAAALPPVESLTFDDDFTAFMKPDVDPALRRDALKKLFADPRFNVMDGLDTYIDDYSIPSPIDAETVRGLVQARYLFNPPKTRINERGEAEDVPEEADQVDAPVAAAEVPPLQELPAPGTIADATPAPTAAADGAAVTEPIERRERETDR